MKVIKGNWNTLLSNYEVLNILQNTKSYKKQMNQLATITYQTIKYLEDTPCKKQNPEKIHEFLKAMEPIKLTKAEKLTLLNLCPTTLVEIQLMVEESEERLSEEEAKTVLQIVANLRDEQDAEQET
ncbi:DNA-directed RNA polymerase III subunit RPC9-like [Temnothorax curvispinosus]|uniref:DNA-directed RNA polymerase III subunit RPC9 n=1 Tax=Temnothorax curvispinosus TaxID=300111 RepID=A0A6J1QWG4_9HYME|nr:DNA-directed RNA polymerase III subunit RPC9-like [Temnothorax curvispinosus]XP_024867162.1 DNA-directed RNA polymerase III subunit RPC9-like [Temnothorax curvispinosus]XP_024867163.1 DNA-directed RNA polymerase III subunit RPC9-like [Temnothorax curvispinosus]XP_024886667.1 DNA-directed RNA polymerase III subunit RPC9-like [Temnothorax curvispinosus]XP_024886668.1 DNA-directed RNA polymerase III subunit RPC9-like [Temnothorax curvispinosus]XP_024886669.1 DNA-directed RNA polymerase III sub